MICGHFWGLGAAFKDRDIADGSLVMWDKRVQEILGMEVVLSQSSVGCLENAFCGFSLGFMGISRGQSFT